MTVLRELKDGLIANMEHITTIRHYYEGQHEVEIKFVDKQRVVITGKDAEYFWNIAKVQAGLD